MTRQGRRLNGILLFDKPQGMTSNAALQRVKRIYRARKAGHTGSLDPLATGLLPICFGEATKVCDFLLGANKHYIITACFGVVTDTGDADGTRLAERAVDTLDGAALQAILARYTGVLEQIPPMFSALKHRGQRLYELARQGLEVERKPRTIRIDRLRLLAVRGIEADLEVLCSKGTYVRTLVADIGEALGPGAHVSALRRVGLGPYDEAVRMHTWEDIEAVAAPGCEALDALLLPMESALVHWPALHLSNEVAFYVRQGQPVWVPKAPAEGWVRLYSSKDHFLGMGVILQDGRVAPKRLVSGA
ncbi:MAG: tRNA pseudouridine(55) synthase TruB [Nitrococcus mobilis]|nr:tRNA pseudouridine(55) synthase TruB [Nitrococcus mobilis]